MQSINTLESTSIDRKFAPLAVGTSAHQGTVATKCSVDAGRQSFSWEIFATADVPSSRPDLSTALDAVHGNRKVLERVVKVFLDECPRLFEVIETALHDEDVAAVRQAAHMIKCSMRLFGLRRGYLVADRLQRICLCDGDPANELLAELRWEFERVRTVLATPHTVDDRGDVFEIFQESSRSPPMKRTEPSAQTASGDSIEVAR